MKYGYYRDYEILKSWTEGLAEGLSPRIVNWWNSFNHDLYYECFEECLEKMVYNHMEKG
jgi:hypothetical protein